MRLFATLSISIAFLSSCTAQSASRSKAEPVDINQLPIVTPDTVSALGNNIMTIYQDKLNNYWFASWEEGLYKYDGKNILHYSTKQGLPSNRIDEIKEDKSGNIYFNSCYPSSAICMFNGQTFTTLPVTASNDWKLEPDDLWFKFSYDSALVYRYDGNSLYKLQLPKHPEFGNPCPVYSIYKDSKGYVWFGTNPLGVFRYDGKTIDWISEIDVTELHDGPANGVRSIIEDKDGYFWFNSMYRYKVYDTASSNTHSQKHSFYSREPSIGNIDGKEDSDFWEYLSIAKDNEDDLWIATYWNGVWRYNGQDVTYYPVQANGQDISMFSIYKDNQGDLWLGTHKNGAYKFNGKSFERFNPR